MYHCHIHFYLIGDRSRWKAIEDEVPPENFTYSMCYSDGLQPELLSQSDAAFVDMSGWDAQEDFSALMESKQRGTRLVLLADESQTEYLVSLTEEEMDEVDIWRLPLGERELKFRFQKWIQDYKLSKDYWQSSQFLDACINSSPDLVWYKTKDGIHEKVNDSFCLVVNKSRSRVEGQRHSYIWNVEDDDPACVESEQEVMSKRITCVSNEMVKTDSGERLLTTYKSPLFDIDGSVMGTVGVAIDVTRERAYERQLIEKNETMEKLFSTMDCGVLVHSVDGRRVISVNQAALRLLGYDTQEEMLEDGFNQVAKSVLDEDKPKLRKCIRSLKKAGDSTSVEYRVRHKDGKLLYILGNVKLIREGGRLFYQRFLLDYTAQKLREEKKWAEKDREIAYQEQLFQIFATFLANNVDDIYMMLDGSGEKVEFVSNNVERVLGVSAETLIGDLTVLGPAKYIRGHSVRREDLNCLVPGMNMEPMETERIHRKTGEHRWFQESVNCVAVQDVKKIIVYISDRTRERRTQDTLSEALEMAQVANKAKSTFLSNVSHDIRTPMNAIMGFLPLLREEAGEPERVLEYTQKISAASQHLLGLINSVLDMNKIESGSVVLNLTELSLAEIIDELNAIIRPQAKDKDQSFHIYTESITCELLLGDKLRITQILINILSNAVKYTQNGGWVEMRVTELPQVDRKYSRIRFTINDNGRGMSEEFQQVLFDPFTRELNTRLNKIQGTGLGMAITKNLVDLMNGSISVKSQPGKGSEFVVELELRVQEQQDDPHFWRKHGISRMIVADDNEDICLDIQKKMEDSQVAVDYAIDGAQAVEKIRQARKEGQPYDLILLDWKMPGLDGLGTAQQLRDNYKEKIPILLFTAYDWNDIEQEALQVGIEHFLPKPFFMSNFKETIQRMGVKREPKGMRESCSVVKGKHVLVVEDIDVNRLILMKILTKLGAVCDEAENGEEAVKKFTAATGEDAYDLIMMDVQMPILNGHQATMAIRASQHPLAKKVAVIAMTADAFIDDVRDALNAGMDAHVSKPIVLEQLTNTIEDVFERKAKQEQENLKA